MNTLNVPPEITRVFHEYLTEVGLLEIAYELLYGRPVKVNDGDDETPNQQRIYNLKDGSKWSARRPVNNQWSRDGDMTWIDPANEYTYELILQIWRDGGFDTVIDTIAEKFGVDGLWLDGTSLIVVSHFKGCNLHNDLPGSNSKAFNVIFPIIIPNHGLSQLLVAERGQRCLGDDDDYDYEDDKDDSTVNSSTSTSIPSSRVSDDGGNSRNTANNAIPINFQHNVGILVGGDSIHGTGNCDYRTTKEIRLAVAVYFTDTNKDNVADFAEDSTAYYPPTGSTRFLMAQAGRHWKYDSNASLKNDIGRKELNIQDRKKKKAYCSSHISQTLEQKEGIDICGQDLEFRNSCLKTCEVFMSEDKYYEHLGKIMDWPTEQQ